MKQVIALILCLILAIAGTEAKASYKIESRNGLPVVLSTEDESVVLARFDRALPDREMPAEVRSFLETYVGVEAQDGSAFVHLEGTEEDLVEPLLGDIEYDQVSPYNDQCPVLNGGRSMTGCVATAMAQVMRYWKYPAVGQGKATYTSSQGAAEYDFSAHPFDWNNILETYTYSRTGFANFNETEAKAVATLMLACGASVNMNYDYAGSGSYISNAYVAMRDHFCYSPDIRYFESDSPNWEDWTETLQEQFEKKQPILYGGVSTSGGHAFVLDGYMIETLESGNKRTLFHVNWGWNGKYNGWFLLRKLQPQEDNFSNLSQRIVINIHPSGGQGIEDVESNGAIQTHKILRDGQLVIERNGHRFSAMGQRIQ